MPKLRMSIEIREIENGFIIENNGDETFCATRREITNFVNKLVKGVK